MDTLDKYIVVLKNIVPLDLCDKIIEEYKNCDQWKQAKTAAQDNSRTCDFIAMSIQNNEYRKKLDFDLFNVAAECLKLYNEKFNYCHATEDTGYDLLRYKEGQYYREHTDSFTAEPRLISCSFHLNDDYTGGEFAFFNKKIIHKVNKSDAIIFPSNFMYPHQILPVTKGTRYSIITWFR